MQRHVFLGAILTAAMIACLGCNNAKEVGNASSSGTAAETFTLAWSEYPSWSVFGVAEEAGLIKSGKGEMGTLEEKWKVDVELKQMDYDGCLTAYSSGTTDAVCITNMDILAPSLGRNSVAILPTSTSDGADACIVTDAIQSIDDLKGKNSWGFEASVSQYMFERALEEQGKRPKDFPFKQMDPQLAAQAMQTNQDDIDSIVVWNPFVIQTLRAREGETKVLFDSTSIPEEIVDMVVVGEDSLKKSGGEAFAMVMIDAFYEVNKMIAGDDGDATLIALGKKFAGLELDDMKEIVKQTKFYQTPEAGIGLYERADFQSTIMPRVVDFCATHGIVESKPTVAFSAGGGEQLQFDTSYMKKYQSQ